MIARIERTKMIRWFWAFGGNFEIVERALFDPSTWGGATLDNGFGAVFWAPSWRDSCRYVIDNYYNETKIGSAKKSLKIY